MREHLLILAIITPVGLTAQAAPSPVGGTLDVGYVSSAGNSSVQTFSLGQALTWKASARLTAREQLRSIYGEADNKVNANSLNIGVWADYTVFDGVGATAGAEFERNRFAGIAQRTRELAGATWHVNAPRDSIRVDAGGVWTQQRSTLDSTTDFTSLRAALVIKHVLGAGASFQEAVEVLPNLDNHADWQLNSESAIVAPLSRRLGLKAAYVVKYDNLPEPTFKTTDRILTAGLQITF